MVISFKGSPIPSIRWNQCIEVRIVFKICNIAAEALILPGTGFLVFEEISSKLYLVTINLVPNLILSRSCLDTRGYGLNYYQKRKTLHKASRLKELCITTFFFLGSSAVFPSDNGGLVCHDTTRNDARGHLCRAASRRMKASAPGCGAPATPSVCRAKWKRARSSGALSSAVATPWCKCRWRQRRVAILVPAPRRPLWASAQAHPLWTKMDVPTGNWPEIACVCFLCLFNVARQGAPTRDPGNLIIDVSFDDLRCYRVSSIS